MKKGILRKLFMLVNVVLCFGLLKAQSSSTNLLSKVEHISSSNIDHMITLMELDESIEIEYWTMGCNMWKPQQRKISIRKIGDSFLLHYYERSKWMNLMELQPILAQLEASFSLMNPNGYCTSKSKLSIKIKDQIYLGFDQSCQWKGFYDLFTSLFII